MGGGLGVKLPSSSAAGAEMGKLVFLLNVFSNHVFFLQCGIATGCTEMEEKDKREEAMDSAGVSELYRATQIGSSSGLYLTPLLTFLLGALRGQCHRTPLR